MLSELPAIPPGGRYVNYRRNVKEQQPAWQHLRAVITIQLRQLISWTNSSPSRCRCWLKRPGPWRLHLL